MADANHQEHSNGHCNHHPGNHFLVVAYGIQSHISPAIELARGLVRADGSILATLSVPISGHRRMFPSLASPDEETSDGVISYVPFSDGFDDGTRPKSAQEMAHSRRTSFESLSAVVHRLAANGRPVMFIICTVVMPPVLDVACKHGIPLAVYWIQPVTVLAAYYHYFHGCDELITSHAADPAYKVSLPGLRPVRIKDLPSFLVDTAGSELSLTVMQAFRELFEYTDKAKPKILVNTFDTLEATALRAMQPYLELFAVGPMVGSTEARIRLFEQDNKSYMDWLGAWPERSVVYISFGSILIYNRRQVEEMLQGLRECGRPYLWVVRKDGREEEVERCLGEVPKEGKVVEWCNQLEVLSHPSVGCFVTHCGWNSTLEAVMLGVPMVAVPNWSDQPTNAYLVEEEWLVGARAERDGEGVLVGTELVRCVELVMGENETGEKIRESAKVLRERTQETMAACGPSERIPTKVLLPM